MRLTTPLTFAGVGATGAGTYLSTFGTAGGGVLVLLAGLVLLGLRLGLDAETRSALRGVLPRGRSVAAVAFAFLLVTTAAGTGVFGPGAQDVADDLSPVGEGDAFLLTAAAVGTVAAAVGTGAVVYDTYLDDDSKEVMESDANETMAEIYSKSGALASDANTTFTIMDNQIADGSRTIGFMKGKRAALAAFSAGHNESVAKQWAQENVTDYFSTMQINALAMWQKQILRAQHWDNLYYDHPEIANSATHARVDQSNYTNIEYVNGTATLANGSTRNVTVWHGHSSDSNWEEYSNPIPLADYSGPRNTYDGRNNMPLHIRGYNGSAVVLRDFPLRGHVIGAWKNADDASQTVINNTDVWTSNLYQTSNMTEQNASAIIENYTTPEQLYYQYRTDNGTGELSAAAASLAATGYNTSLDHSFTLTVNPGTNSSRTINGTLFTNWEPGSTNGSFVTNHTYNASKTTKPVYVATNDGVAYFEDKKFRIEEMRNVETGETVSKVSPRDYNRQTDTVNETLLRQQLTAMEEIRKELDERQAAAAGGGSSSSSNMMVVALALIVLAGIGLRNRGGGGRYGR